MRLYSRFINLDKRGQGFLDRDDFLRIPELAINPLGDRIVDAFFLHGFVIKSSAQKRSLLCICSDDNEHINFKQFIRVLARFRPIDKKRPNALNSREAKLKCEREREGFV